MLRARETERARVGCKYVQFHRWARVERDRWCRCI